jgi:hypothetical protein
MVSQSIWRGGAFGLLLSRPRSASLRTAGPRNLSLENPKVLSPRYMPSRCVCDTLEHRKGFPERDPSISTPRRGPCLGHVARIARSIHMQRIGLREWCPGEREAQDGVATWRGRPVCWSPRCERRACGVQFPCVALFCFVSIQWQMGTAMSARQCLSFARFFVCSVFVLFRCSRLSLNLTRCSMYSL